MIKIWSNMGSENGGDPYGYPKIYRFIMGLSMVSPVFSLVKWRWLGDKKSRSDDQGGRAQLMSISRSSSRFAIVVRYLGHRQATKGIMFRKGQAAGFFYIAGSHFFLNTNEIPGIPGSIFL